MNITLNDNFYDTCEFKQFQEFQNGRMVTFGYRINYDRHGKETGRTEPERLSSIGWDDGSPFTEDDYRELMR